MSGAFVAIMMVDQTKAHELSHQLAARGIRPFVATSTDALYEKAGEELVDALVIDNQLQSFLTGCEVTERLQADFVRPVTVLLAPEGMRNDPTVQRLGIFLVESPTSTVEALTALTLSAAEKSLLNRPFVCPRAQRIVSQSEGIQPCTPLILKIAASLREAPASPESLFADMAADPMASAAILRIVNSSAIGRPQKTSSVQEGIRFLGLRRTLSAVLSAGLMQTQEPLLSRVPKEIRRWYSRRGVLIASVAESFARNLEDLPPETAYIHGLLQDVGILVLAQVYGERYVQLLRRVEEIPHLRLEAEERNQFGTSHADVTAALLRTLKLPRALATISSRHHAPITEQQGSAADQALVRVMQIGEAVANIADRPTPQRLMTLNFLLAHYQGREAELSSRSLAEAIRGVAELSQVLGLPAPDEHALAELAEEVKHRAKHTFDVAFDPYHSKPVHTEGGEAQTRDPRAGAPSTPIRQSKALVLEDDAAIAKFVAMALTHVGVEAVHAACTRDALALVHDVDVVLCDIHLGGEDGLAAISQLRSGGYAGPVIIISGDSCRSTVERALKVRISEYLLKPFSKAQLIEKLQKFPGLLPSSVATEPEISPLS